MLSSLDPLKASCPVAVLDTDELSLSPSVAASKKPEYTSLVDEVVNYAKGKGGNDNHEVNAVLNSLALSS
ncbi:hypothetical protein BJF96_g1946 [Verticillium dahliae]|uniref:Uncharacterized protein n=1 Tax=Verticillium dahliae TaxID=27337 RepID=A0AA44WS79_VERDA|nr:hypothetical protein BJF96_g1946 [Verticillium dahliae]